MTRKKTKRKLSKAELQQRRDAAQKSTGPRTPEGKAVSCRNAYKHGMRSVAAEQIRKNWQVGAFARPCRTTCPNHPGNPHRDGDSCSLVETGATKEGGDCLDKTVYLQAFDRLMSTLESGDASNMHAVLAAEGAGALETLQQLRNEIAVHGLAREIPAIDKEGQVILLPNGDPAPGKIVSNPALAHYITLLDKLGINLPELLATPRAIAKEKTESEATDAVSGLMDRLGRFEEFSAPRLPIDSESERVPE